MGMSSLPGGSRGSRRAPMADINVTPLVDVMLVLLIIFMITAPLLVAGVPVNLPDSKAGALDQQDKPVTVSLDTAGKVYIDDQEVPDAGLADRLAVIAAKQHGGGDTPQVFLRADRVLDYGRVMHVMSALRTAGLTRIALLTAGEDKR